MSPIYWTLYHATALATGIQITRETRVGPGLRLPHFGAILIHEAAVIGANVTILHGVTIGTRDHGGAPIIEDDVEIGCGAVILGPVRIGQGAKVGANATVVADVPPGCTVVGTPGVIVRRPTPRRVVEN